MSGPPYPTPPLTDPDLDRVLSEWGEEIHSAALNVDLKSVFPIMNPKGPLHPSIPLPFLQCEPLSSHTETTPAAVLQSVVWLSTRPISSFSTKQLGDPLNNRWCHFLKTFDGYILK